MDEHPALALREKKDATIIVAVDLVKRGEADAVVTAGHTGAGHGRRGPAPGTAARRRPPGAGGADDHRRPARSSCSTSAPTRIRPRRTSSSTPRWARSSPSACWASPSRASRCCRSARRRARAMPGSSARPSCSMRSGLRFEGNVEGKDLPSTWPTSSSATRSSATSSSSSSRACRRFIFDLWRGEFERSLRGRLALPADAARHRPDPAASSTTRGGRVAAARRPRDGHHHPRPGEAADGDATPARWRRRRPGPASRHSSPRRSSGAAASRSDAEAAPWRRSRPPSAAPRTGRERTGADGRAGGHRRARPAGGLRGAGRRPRRSWRRGLAPLLGGPAVSVRDPRRPA